MRKNKNYTRNQRN